MTVADLRFVSIGFVIDLCLARLRLAAGEENDEESKYLKMKGIADIVEERHDNGEMTDEKYSDFLNKYKRLSEQYGFDY